VTTQLERLAVSEGFDAQAFLESLMHNVPGAIYRCALDRDWTMHLIGDEIERISGYAASDFIESRRRTYASIIHPDDRADVEFQATSAARRDEPFELEYRIVHADGSGRWVLERGQKTVDASGAPWLDGIIFDVTARRRFEELARQSEAEAARLAEVEESRSRIIEVSDAARRRIERDLHDGAQQRFVALSLMLRVAQRRAAAGEDVSEALATAAEELDAGLNDLRELARGIHPAVLTDHGLPGAVHALAARCSVPIKVHVEIEERLVPAVELAAYFTISEALANAAKYSGSTAGQVSVTQLGTELIVEVRDNGRGGAQADGAGGLNGLVDRLQALGGDLVVESPPGGGTTLRATLPWRPAN
jgi:PAS domain S-box-containing protein